MTLQLPSLSRYLSGLAILIPIAAIFYFIQDNPLMQGMGTFNTLLAGLLAGHLLTSFVVDRKTASDGARSVKAENNTQERKTIYVGNIAYSANRHELEKLFAGYGSVYSTRIMTDRVTRKPRGYGFIEMGRHNADKAIASLNGAVLKGRTLKVGEANERSNY